MAAVFLPPLPIAPTIVSTNAVANAPASRLLLDEPGLVARATGTLSVTFDTVGQPFNAVAVIGSNLASNHRVRVRAGSTANMSSGVVFDATVNAWSGAAPLSGAITYVPLPSTIVAQYVLVEMTGGAQSTIEASRVIIGQRVEVDGIDQNAEKTDVSGSNVEDGPGWTTVGEARTRSRWTANVGNIHSDAYYRDWTPFLRRVGKHTGFLFIPQTASTKLQHQAVLVRNSDDPKTVDVTSSRFRVEMTLFEV